MVVVRKRYFFKNILPKESTNNNTYVAAATPFEKGSMTIKRPNKRVNNIEYENRCMAQS